MHCDHLNVLNPDEEKVSFSMTYHAIATKIVELTRLDPLTVTALEMDGLDPIFLCTAEDCRLTW